jgi:apolipoprotein N-acyltransferase
MLDLNERGSIDTALPPARSAPPYASWGDLIFLLAALFFAATFYFLHRRS